jgi:hypothetical protein
MTESPTIIKAPNPEDLLAILPSLAGMPLRDSVVIAPFIGKFAPAAMRVDLPAHDDVSAHLSLASTLLGLASKVRGCDGVAIVIYSEEPFGQAFARWYDFQDHLVERFHSAGFGIKAALCVAGGGWARFDEVPPVDGYPLSLIEESPAGAHVPRDVSARPVIPSRDSALATAVEETVVGLLDFGEERTGLGLYRAAELPEPVDYLEDILSREPAELSPLALARLIALIQTEGDVDRTVLQIAFGRTVGAQSWENTLRLREITRESDEGPADYLIRESKAGRRDSRADKAGRLLCGDSMTPPSVSRVERGIALLGHTIAHAPATDTLDARCALAWLYWAIGRASAAGEMLATAARIDPRHAMTGVFHTLFHAVSMPEWVFDRGVPGTGSRAARRASARQTMRQ